jgi:hypothetical protein
MYKHYLRIATFDLDDTSINTQLINKGVADFLNETYADEFTMSFLRSSNYTGSAVFTFTNEIAEDDVETEILRMQEELKSHDLDEFCSVTVLIIVV